jgi:hypothetical protein
MSSQYSHPEGSIIITPAEVYAKVTSLTDAVTELVAADKAEERHRAAIQVKVERLEERMTAVERKLLLATGAAAAIGGGLGSWLPGLLGR